MSQVVQALLSEQPFSGYVTDKTIDSFGQDEMVIPTALESDYHFLCEQAEYYGREFFILQGKLFFRERPASSSPVMTIDPKQMLISAQLSLSGEKLLGRGGEHSNVIVTGGSAAASEQKLLRPEEENAFEQAKNGAAAYGLHYGEGRSCSVLFAMLDEALYEK